MALVVEDGTGKPDAESYQTVAAHKIYCDKRGIAYPADDTSIEINLHKGFDFMAQQYSTRWKGYRSTLTQSADWPRYNVEKIGGWGACYLPTEIPREVCEANSELATRAEADDLAPDIERVESDVKIGPLSISYDPTKSVATVFRAVENKLRQFFDGGGIRTRIIRT